MTGGSRRVCVLATPSCVSRRYSCTAPASSSRREARAWRRSALKGRLPQQPHQLQHQQEEPVPPQHPQHLRTKMLLLRLRPCLRPRPPLPLPTIWESGCGALRRTTMTRTMVATLDVPIAADIGTATVTNTSRRRPPRPPPRLTRPPAVFLVPSQMRRVALAALAPICRKN